MARKPKYRHHKATDRAVVSINGRDIYLGQYNSKRSLTTYERIIAEWEASGRSTSFGVAKPDVTVAMLCADYMDYADEYYPRSGKNCKADQIRVALKVFDALLRITRLRLDSFSDSPIYSLVVA